MLSEASYNEALSGEITKSETETFLFKFKTEALH